jgi:hypothetical protein
MKLTLLHLSLSSATPLLLAGPLLAQDLEALYVSDSSNDAIYRLQDLNLDGDYNDPGEVLVFYDEGQGTVALGNNAGIDIGSDGTVYVTDSSEDIILALKDGPDADAAAHELSEHHVYFYGDPSLNLSGVEMVSAGKCTQDRYGRLWVANANNGSGGVDSILRLEDLNHDGDANDLGEAREIYVFPGASTGDYIPMDARAGRDGRIYFTDVASTGVVARGMYVLDDLNGDGSYDSSESTPFFLPPPPYDGTNFFWGMVQAPDDSWYLCDGTQDVVWHVRDANGDGRIQASDPAETTLYWDSGAASSSIWMLDITPNGDLYCAESQSPDRIVVMRDIDGNGSIDTGTELFTVYDETLSGVNIANPRSLVADKNRGGTYVRYCTANPNSSGSPAILYAHGSRSTLFNDLTLVAGDLPASQNGIFFYGAGQGQSPFGNGFLCVLAGSAGIYRLPVQQADAGGKMILELDTSGSSTLQVGSTWNFQTWFRDPAAGGSAFNTSDAVSITLLP